MNIVSVQVFRVIMELISACMPLSVMLICMYAMLNDIMVIQ